MKTFEELLALLIKEESLVDFSVEEIVFGLRELQRQIKIRMLQEEMEEVLVPKNTVFSHPIFYEVPFNEEETKGMTIIDNRKKVA